VGTTAELKVLLGGLAAHAKRLVVMMELDEGRQ